MRLQDIPEDIEPQVGDIIEIEQDDVCFEVRIIGITADGYLCEQDNVQGAVLLEGVALDQDDVTDITGYITEEKVRLDPKCWKGKKIGNPKTKIKGGVRVNNCVPEGQEEIEEAGPFSYGYKKPRKGSVAYWAEKKRKEQEKGKPPIEPKDQMVGVAKVTKGVAEGYTGRETKDGTWRVFKDGKAVAVAGPFKSREEAAAWIKKQKQGVNESTEQSLQKKIQSRRDALGLAREQRRARGQHQQGQREIKLQAEIDDLNDQLRELKKQGVAESPEDNRQWSNKDNEQFRRAVRDIEDNFGPNDAWTKTKQRQIKQQIKTEPMSGPKGKLPEQGVAEGSGPKEKQKTPYRDINSPEYRKAADKQKQQMAKDAAAEPGKKLADKIAKKGVAEGAEEHEYSLSMGNRQRPGSDRLDTDSRSRMDSLRAQEHDLKQRTIDILLKRHPNWERSDLELAPLRELIDMLRKPANEDMDEAKYQGREVPLGKKMAGDVKKSKVYVRKPNGKVVKVNFGDKNMTIKKSNPKRRKSFRARHNCDNPGPRWRARYWSCRSW